MDKTVEHVPGTTPPIFYGYIIIIASVCIMVLFVGTLSAFGVFFKPVMNEFGWTRAMTSGAFSLSWILQGTLAVIMGTLTDKIGPRVVMTLSSICLGLGYICMSRLESIGQFYLLYGFIGAGMGGLNVSLVSTAARWFIKRRGLMAGIILAGGGVGSLITPPVAHWVIASTSWRQSYIMMGCMVLIIAVFAAQFLRRDPAQMGQLPYGHERSDDLAFRGNTEGTALREAIRTKEFWMISTMFFALGFCPYVIIVHIAPHATDMGISASRAAILISVAGGVAIIGRIALGIAGDRIGNRRTFIVSFVLMTFAVFLFNRAGDLWLLFTAAAVMSFSWGAGALASPLVAEFFGLKTLGVNLGVINLGYGTGAAVGPFMAGYIFDTTGQYQTAFLLTTLVAFAALVMSILLKPRMRE